MESSSSTGPWDIMSALITISSAFSCTQGTMKTPCERLFLDYEFICSKGLFTIFHGRFLNRKVNPWRLECNQKIRSSSMVLTRSGRAASAWKSLTITSFHLGTCDVRGEPEASVGLCPGRAGEPLWGKTLFHRPGNIPHFSALFKTVS